MHKISTLCMRNLVAIFRPKQFAIVSLQTLFTSFSFLLFSSISQIRANTNIVDVIWPVLEQKISVWPKSTAIFSQIIEPKRHKSSFSVIVVKRLPLNHALIGKQGLRRIVTNRSFQKLKKGDRGDRFVQENGSHGASTNRIHVVSTNDKFPSTETFNFEYTFSTNGLVLEIFENFSILNF